MSWIQCDRKGVLIKVKAVPCSSKNQLSLLDDHLKINITAPALKNKANQEMIKFLAKQLQFKKKDIQIIIGKKGKQKQILITNHSEEEIIAKINRLV